MRAGLVGRHALQLVARPGAERPARAGEENPADALRRRATPPAAQEETPQQVQDQAWDLDLSLHKTPTTFLFQVEQLTVLIQSLSRQAAPVQAMLYKQG